MRWLINYIRSCFCKHEWEHIHNIDIYNESSGNMPSGHLDVYRCNKCGFIQKIKM